MKSAFDKLESPYLDGELEFVTPGYELSQTLNRAVGESPFANVAGAPEIETRHPPEEMEPHSRWPDEEYGDTAQQSISGEAGQSIHDDEANAFEEAFAFVDEAAQWIQDEDFIVADEASPSDAADEWDSIADEAISELEGEPPREDSIGLEFDIPRSKAKRPTPSSSLLPDCAQPSPWPDRKCADSKPSAEIKQRRIRRLCEVISAGIETKEHNPNRSGGPGLFAGSYDWHSAVHAHWALLSIARVNSDQKLEAWLAGRLTDKALRAERDFLKKNPQFEQPYGRAWLLLLLSELGRRSRVSRESTALEQEMRESVLGWLERSPYPEGGTKTAPSFIAKHNSWLFAYMLFAMTNPKPAGIRDRLSALRTSKIEPARVNLAAAKHSDDDFLFLPAVQAVADRVDSTAPAAAYPVGPARALLDPPLNEGNAHSAGATLVRIWPHAIDMRAGDEKACSRYHAGMNEMFSRTDHWADSFPLVSHWVPQFMWMALWLAEGRP